MSDSLQFSHEETSRHSAYSTTCLRADKSGVHEPRSSGTCKEARSELSPVLISSCTLALLEAPVVCSSVLDCNVRDAAVPACCNPSIRNFVQDLGTTVITQTSSQSQNHVTPHTLHTPNNQPTKTIEQNLRLFNHSDSNKQPTAGGSSDCKTWLCFAQNEPCTIQLVVALHKKSRFHDNMPFSHMANLNQSKKGTQVCQHRPQRTANLSIQ